MKIEPFLFLVIAIAGAPSSATSRTLRVPGDDYPTIQSAFDSVQAFDTVLVELGRYPEALIAPPVSFTLRGNVTPDTGDFPRPTIDPSSLPGSDTLKCLRIPEGGIMVIEAFRIRNPALSNGSYRAAILADSAVHVTMRDCRIDSTWAALLHAPWDTITSVFFTLERSSFEHMYGPGSAGVAVQRGWVQATDCRFSGQGFWLVTCGNGSRFERCVFRDNQHGHLLVAGGSETEIRDCIFGPYGPWAFVPVVLSPFDGIVSGCVFADCHGGQKALEVQNSCIGHPAIIADNIFLHNDVVMGQGSGGASIACTSGFDHADVAVIFEHNSFSDYRSYNHPRALAVNTGAVIDRCRFSHLTLAPSILPFAAVKEYNGDVTMRDCVFDSTGIAAQGELGFDALWNWWGDSSGPYHTNFNPEGLGDTVLGNVSFDPWYTDTSFLAIRGIDLPLPTSFELSAYPNPFNSTARLHLVPDQVRMIRVTLYDMLGRVVQDVFRGPLAFERAIVVNGDALASGIYFARVEDIIERRPLGTVKLALVK